MQPCGLTQLGLSALCVSKGGNHTPFDTSVVELQTHPDVTLKLIESQVPLNSRAEKKEQLRATGTFPHLSFSFLPPLLVSSSHSLHPSPPLVSLCAGANLL